jgi:phosphate transport system ATP-binding protein
MAQARRATDECIYMLLGRIIEHAPTDQLFLHPQHEETERYIEGRYG